MLLLTPPTNAAIVSCPELSLVIVILPPGTNAISLLFPLTSDSLKVVVEGGTSKSYLTSNINPSTVESFTLFQRTPSPAINSIESVTLSASMVFKRVPSGENNLTFLKKS